jgi:hypothetical protein
MRLLLKILLGILALLFIVQAWFSLQWPIAHDEAPLFYEAFLVRSEGRIPYLDIFDFQMPGSFAAYYALGTLSGFNAFGIRILDLLILTTLLVITFFSTQRFGKTSAFAAAILFGLKYLQGGPSMALQREYLFLIFVALAVWISMRDILTPKHRFILGLLFGLSAIIKPHAAIGLIPILLFDIADMIKRRKLTLLNAAVGSILPASAGFFIPIMVVIAWLSFNNALTPFLKIAMNYWPLYSQINGLMEITPTAQRIPFLLNQVWRLGGSGLWLLPAMFGVYLNQNKKIVLLASLALCYAIYPALSGQFFQYHYIPFIYFIILLASLSISTFDSRPSAINVYLLFIIFFAAVLLDIRPSSAFLRQLEGKPVITSTYRANEIARFLEGNLHEGDTIQPLDWTGGTLLAMLETHTRIATPYVFDFYFYHHVSSPYIQSLRMDFLDRMRIARPRFIIEVTAVDKPWVIGEDTSREFPEFRKFLRENYSIKIQKDDYAIYERY